MIYKKESEKMLSDKVEKKSFWLLFSLVLILFYAIFVLISEFLYSDLPLELWLNQNYILKWRDVLIPIWLSLIGLVGYLYFKRKRLQFIQKKVLKILDRKCSFVNNEKIELCRNQAVKMKIVANGKLVLFWCIDHEKEVMDAWIYSM